MNGRGFSAAYYQEVVRPLLARELPRLRYAAARLGSGSDVLGLDDAMSRDHDWGCRLTLLVDQADHASVPVVDDLLARRLPDDFRGHPVRFATSWDPKVSHKVEVATVRAFAESRLGCDPLRLSTPDWLVLTGQAVLEVIAGPVYHDDTAELAAVRRTLAWYLPEVERYVLGSGWHRLTQRMSMVGRTAETGQPLQSRLLCAALAGDLTSLAFLIHQRWQPYEKWRGVAFATLPGAGELTGWLDAAIVADPWQEREAALVAAIELLLDAQRRRGLPTPAEGVARFFDRPYRTLTGAVPELLLADLTDPTLTSLPRVGGVSQWVDSVDVLTGDPPPRAALRAAYRAWR